LLVELKRIARIVSSNLFVYDAREKEKKLMPLTVGFYWTLFGRKWSWTKK
jgi:hypothetical protein